MVAVSALIAPRIYKNSRTFLRLVFFFILLLGFSPALLCSRFECSQPLIHVIICLNCNQCVFSFFRCFVCFSFLIYIIAGVRCSYIRAYMSVASWESARQESNTQNRIISRSQPHDEGWRRRRGAIATKAMRQCTCSIKQIR